MIKMFGMCCPKKPKVSLDYIIKWIEENDAIINELKEWQTIIDSQIGDIEAWKAQVEKDITTRVVQAIEDYDWSTLPEEALSHKIDKVTSVIDGNFAVFNTEGNIEDSGITSVDICTMEFYNGDEHLFRESSVINSILTAGIHNVSYVCNNDTNHNFYSILFVSNNYGKISPRGVTGYNVIQYLLDNKGYYIRYRQFRDAAHTDPLGDWTDWKNADVVNSVEAGIYDPVSSDAVYAALQEKADKVVDAITGNLASLDENGNLQDSGKKSSDFAEAEHDHKEIRQTNSDDELALVSATANEDGNLWINLSLREVGEQTKVAKITYNNIDNLNRALNPDTTPRSGSDNLVTSGGVYTAINGKSDKEFCDKVYSRLMEFEKKNSVEYEITATYEYGGRPILRSGEADIIYEYDSTSEKIMILYNVDYLYKLTFVGDVFVIKDMTTGTSLGTATVVGLMGGPNRIKLSGLPLPYNSSYSGKSIGIAITHGNYQ